MHSRDVWKDEELSDDMGISKEGRKEGKGRIPEGKEVHVDTRWIDYKRE